MSKPPFLFDQLARVPQVIQMTALGGAAVLVADPFEVCAHEIRATLEHRGKIWLIGNGGSAAVAAHIANDIVGSGMGFAGALNDPPTMTALSNDHGYNQIYVRQLEGCLHTSDLVIAISSSGVSKNILLAAEYAVSRAKLLTLSGMRPENPLRKMGHLNLYIPFETYGAVEIGHLAILHECVSRAVCPDEKLA